MGIALCPQLGKFHNLWIVSPFIFVPLFLSAFWTAFVSLYFYKMMMLAQLTLDCNKTALGEHHLPSKRPQPPPSACILHTLAVGSGANLFQMSMFMLYFINPRLCCSNWKLLECTFLRWLVVLDRLWQFDDNWQLMTIENWWQLTIDDNWQSWLLSSWWWEQQIDGWQVGWLCWLIDDNT